MKKLYGYLHFAYIDSTVAGVLEEHPMELNVIGTLMSGKEFYENVDSGLITNNDGLLGGVYINNLQSNLGLVHNDFYEGSFMVDGEMWLNICEEYDVEVEWCNK